MSVFARVKQRHRRLLRRQCWRGLVDVAPMLIGTAPFGFLFAILAQSAALSFWQSQGLSLFVFAGSAQFVAVAMLLAAAPVPSIWLSTLCLNLRHVLYGASLKDQAKSLSQPWLMALSFFLTDESYATLIQRIDRGGLGFMGRWYWLAVSLWMYLNWQFWCAAGYGFSHWFEGVEQWGLEFAMIATFLTIIVAQIKTKALLCSVLAAVFCSLLLEALPFNLGLPISAAIAVLFGVLVLKLERRHG